MLRIQLPDGTAADAELIWHGPDAGSLRYRLSDDVFTVRDLVGGLPVTGGDPVDLRKAAAILRAKGFWLGPESSMRARRDADRLDELAKGAQP